MNTESPLYRPVRGKLQVTSPPVGQSSQVMLNYEPVATLHIPVTVGGLEFDIVDLQGSVVAHGGDGRLVSIAFPVRRPDGAIMLELRKTWRPTRVRVLRTGQAELRLRLGHRQPWSWVTDEQGMAIASIQEISPGNGVPGDLQLTLNEPALSVVQAVAMAEFAWTRIGLLRSKMI